MKIGFVGLGIMGRPMALNILKGGFDLTVWARRAESMAPLLEAGAKGAGSAAEVAAGCDVVFSMVSDAADVEQVALGAGGVVEGARPGLIFVDMSTIAPAAAQVIAAQMAERGLAMLDAPVSGGEVGAISGGLTIMVGGDAAAFDIAPEASSMPVVAIPTHRRGWLPLPRLHLETRHPLGLIRAWSLFQPDQRCLVYPTPAADAPPLHHDGDDHPGSTANGRGRDDFAGLRHHQASDSPRHVAWKSVARGGPWRTKEFDGGGSQRVWLDWQHLPPGAGIEARLSQLARWIVDADAAS